MMTGNTRHTWGGKESTRSINLMFCCSGGTFSLFPSFSFPLIYSSPLCSLLDCYILRPPVVPLERGRGGRWGEENKSRKISLRLPSTHEILFPFFSCGASTPALSFSLSLSSHLVLGSEGPVITESSRLTSVCFEHPFKPLLFHSSPSELFPQF